jgi:hypothetical protein
MVQVRRKDTARCQNLNVAGRNSQSAAFVLSVNLFRRRTITYGCWHRKNKSTRLSLPASAVVVLERRLNFLNIAFPQAD